MIGRLLHETGSIQEDLYQDLRSASLRRGQSDIDFAFLLDGLAAEREQSVTIDVAHRHFATASRKYRVADCPGHPEYTRNMFTGMSSADAAILLVDARKGLLQQSKRHALIVSLLGIPHLIVAINKMDLVGWSELRFREIVKEYEEFAQKLAVPDLGFVPVCALHGDNVVRPSERMAWYQGGSLLQRLERLNALPSRNLIDFRFVVQCVVRARPDFRGLAGRVDSGTIRPGEEIAILPAARLSRVRSIETFTGQESEAAAGHSVVLTLYDDWDVGRGDMLSRKHNLPQVSRALEVTLCWMAETRLCAGARLLFVQSARSVRAVVRHIHYRIDMNTLHREAVDELDLNDIARVDLETSELVCFDPYRLNRATGCFLLVDPVTAATVAAGVIRGSIRTLEDLPVEVDSPPAAVLWFTGLPAAGKSTLVEALAARLGARGCRVVVLDGDRLRAGLCSDLGFSERDRDENVRRVAEVARLFFQQGTLVLVSLVSPLRRQRALARSLIPPGRFWECFVRARVEICAARDPKGLYARAKRGEVTEFTGVSAPYEEPLAPELVLDTEQTDVADLIGLIEQRLRLERRLVTTGP